MVQRQDIQLIKAAMAVNQPVIIWGSPGVGKTAYVQSMAKEMNADLITLMGNVMMPEDFLGMPLITKHGDTDIDVTTFATPGWALKGSEAKKPVIVFLDELSTARPQVQAAMLRVVLERKVGDHDLGDHVTFVAAANPVNETAEKSPFTPALANRFMHVEWEINHEQWCEWLLEEHRGNRLAPLVAGYVYTRGSKVLAPGVPKEKARASGAFASPRSWAAFVAVGGKLPNDDMLSAAGEANIGREQAIQFLSWMREQDLPAVDDVLSGKIDEDWWGKSGTRGDQVYAVASSIGQEMISNPDREIGDSNVFDLGWKALVKATQETPGIIIGVTDMIVSKGIYPDRVPMAALAAVSAITRRQ